MKENTLHIALSTDHNYVEFVSILLVSVFDNNKEFDSIHIHLLAYELSCDDIAIIKKHIPVGKGHLDVYDMGNIHELLSVSVPYTISLAAYSRLFLSSLLPEDVSNVVYMDTDSILCSSLKDLWSTNISDYFIAGVLDDVSDFSKTAIGLSKKDIYINSGFLLINLELWRKEQLERKIIKELVEHDGKIYHHDQGLLNKVCRNKILVLPINYNMVTNFYTFPYKHFKDKNPFYSLEKFNSGKKNPIFLHFTAGVANRPWMKNCKHPLKKYFLKYKSMSLFSENELQEDSRKFSLKLLAFLFYHIPILYYCLIKIRSFVLKES